MESGKRDFYYDAFSFWDEEVPFINGEQIVDEQLIPSIQRVAEKEFKANDECPGCHKKLLLIKKRYYIDGVRRTENLYDEIKVWACLNCTYYKVFNFYWNYESHVSGYHWNLFVSKIKDFDDKFPEEFHSEIASQLVRDEKNWYRFNPINFEKFVAQVIKANYAHSEVLHVGKSGDGGVDVFYIDTEKKEWLVQVKHKRSPESSIGVEVVRSLLGSMMEREIDRGIIISTADHFTTEAVKLKRKMERRDCKIDLIDIGILQRMVRNVQFKEAPLRFLLSDELNIAPIRENEILHWAEVVSTLRKYFHR